jgi:hypothetical protein
MKLTLCLAFFFPLLTFAQSSKKDGIWLPLRPLIGSWLGSGEGQPGKGSYERSYRFVLNGNFIEVKNRSTYPPTEKKPEGETHEDVGFISYDKFRKTFVLRQFHGEGFVNRYVLESIAPDRKTIVFISEAIENIPPGWRAKETYRLLGEDEVTEIFELAAPEKGFEVYTTTSLRKKPD